MTPAVRWAIGILVLIVAGALWMFWKPGAQQPQAAAKAEVAKQQVAATPADTTPGPMPAGATATITFDVVVDREAANRPMLPHQDFGPSPARASPDTGP